MDGREMSWLGLALVAFLYIANIRTGAGDSECKNRVLNKMTANGMLTQPSISREGAGLGLIQK